MRTIVVMSMKNYKDYEGVWKKELSKLATKIADHLPGSAPISGPGKFADMFWIWEVFIAVISFGT